MKHLAPPLYVDEDYEYKTSTGVGVQGGAPFTSAGANLTDTDGNVMAISITPRVNCFWRVQAECIALYTSGFPASSYAEARFQIMISPNDLDGQSQMGGLGMLLHTTMTDWNTMNVAGSLKCAGGTTYTATMNLFLNPSGTASYWRGGDFSWISGYTFGHGSF